MDLAGDIIVIERARYADLTAAQRAQRVDTRSMTQPGRNWLRMSRLWRLMMLTLKGRSLRITAPS